MKGGGWKFQVNGKHYFKSVFERVGGKASDLKRERCFVCTRIFTPITRYRVINIIFRRCNGYRYIDVAFSLLIV